MFRFLTSGTLALIILLMTRTIARLPLDASLVRVWDNCNRQPCKVEMRFVTRIDMELCFESPRSQLTLPPAKD